MLLRTSEFLQLLRKKYSHFVVCFGGKKRKKQKVETTQEERMDLFPNYMCQFKV